MQTASEEPCATRGNGPIIAAMPLYNEEETVGSVVLQAKRHVDKVLCLDDGSSDASARIARKCGAQVHQHRYNRGYGGALKSIFSIAREQDVEALVILDSDGQHDITGLWMRRSGNQDRAFQTADEIKAEVIRELAFLLA